MKSSENTTVFPCSGVCLGIDPVVDDFEANSPSVRRSFELRLENHVRVLESCDRHFAVKPNLAFFLRFGSWGIGLLESFCARVKKDFPILVDGKFGEIDNSLQGYLDFAFGTLGAQAVTINPFLGESTIRTALASCLEFTGGFGRVYVLCATSQFGSSESDGKPGLGRLQDAAAIIGACSALEEAFGMAQEHCPLGLVIGAGRSETLSRPDLIASGLPILAPGLGAQGASWDDARTVLHRRSVGTSVGGSVGNDCLFPLSRFIFDGGRNSPELALQKIQQALDLLDCNSLALKRARLSHLGSNDHANQDNS
jgi:orotidine 5'-phosphate decarboxylase subfamily 2